MKPYEHNTKPYDRCMKPYEHYTEPYACCTKLYERCITFVTAFKILGLP